MQGPTSATTALGTLAQVTWLLAARKTLPDANSTDDSAPAFSYRQGMQVRHPRYGRGVITELSTGSHRGTVTVQFEIDGVSYVAMRQQDFLEWFGE